MSITPVDSAVEYLGTTAHSLRIGCGRRGDKSTTLSMDDAFLSQITVPNLWKTSSSSSLAFRRALPDHRRMPGEYLPISDRRGGAPGSGDRGGAR